MKVIYKEVGKKAKAIEIKHTLEEMQKLVGGYIESVHYKDNLFLICNEEGKLEGLPVNVVFGMDYIAGNFFIVADDGTDFVSVEDYQIQEVIEELEKVSV